MVAKRGLSYGPMPACSRLNTAAVVPESGLNALSTLFPEGCWAVPASGYAGGQGNGTSGLQQTLYIDLIH